MSSCCHEKLPKMKQACPNCGDVCLSVSLKTVIHQVQYPENQCLESDAYALCSNHACHVGYFSATHVLKKEKLRFFQVGEESILCYCFDISRMTYLSAVKRGESAKIKGFVIAQTKKAACACDILNPSGRCCLTEFKNMEKSYEKTSNHHT